jgi:hypothetical protein
MRADSLGTLPCNCGGGGRVAVQVLFSIFGGKPKDFRGSSAASGCKGGRLFSPPSRGLCFPDAVIMQVFLARRRAFAAAAGGRNIFAVTEGPTRDAPAREMTSTDERCLVPRSNTLVGANAEAVAPKTRRRVAPLNGQDSIFRLRMHTGPDYPRHADVPRHALAACRWHRNDASTCFPGGTNECGRGCVERRLPVHCCPPFSANISAQPPKPVVQGCPAGRGKAPLADFPTTTQHVAAHV